ncbi:unnamed protein product [marine sediment metagenome]|uniref:Uncharacterized protein n=1 Tax=marine sediment metagenome TaxID=412755 RepID=X1BPZ3_9ZZZZ
MRRGGETIGGYSLIIDTELIRYKWVSVNADYPDYEKLIPTEFNCAWITTPLTNAGRTSIVFF